MVRKLKVGIFKFTCCSGCQVEILNLADKFFELSDKLDFKYVKILKKGRIQNFDIAFIEGAISEDWEIKQLISDCSRFLRCFRMDLFYAKLYYQKERHNTS
jgi:coenzyme F420-reducing hydrogenase gamma subunit